MDVEENNIDELCNMFKQLNTDEVVIQNSETRKRKRHYYETNESVKRQKC